VVSGQLLQMVFFGGFRGFRITSLLSTRGFFGFSVGGVESIGEFFGKTGFLRWEYFPD
jgi:hypothetical protein